MRDERANATCSLCGKEGLRDDMFGADPDLLCEACANRERERTRPTAAGRMVMGVTSGRAPVTVATLAIAIALFVLAKAWVARPAQWPEWILSLTMMERAGRGYITVAQEPWRLLTSAFLHIGFIHILFNAWWIWDLGRAIEYRWGSIRFFLLVVGSAVGANAIQWIFGGPGVGLSGVVYALAGFLFTQRKEDPVAAAIMNPGTTRFLLAWLVIGVVLSQTGTLPIGNWAHGGGGAWGLAAGMAWRQRRRWLWLLVLFLATGALVFAVTQSARTW